jgi:hypothetical protein
MGVVVAALLAVGCAQVDPVLLAVEMPGCVYQGPPTMAEGDVRLSLRLNAVADAGAALVELPGQESVGELSDHLDAVDPRWEHLPEWASTVVEVRIDSGEGGRGGEETLTLAPGTYAVVCIEYPYDGASLAGTAASLRVREG